MIKLAKIKFTDHPILGNLELNFCDSKGVPVDTVIIAGENGCGKSTILDELYKCVDNNHKYPFPYQIDRNISLELYDIDKNDYKNKKLISCYFSSQFREDYKDYLCQRTVKLNNIQNISFQEDLTLSGIFSDVNINFNSGSINNTTALELDVQKKSQRSSNDLARHIQQLLVDVQAEDASELYNEYKRRESNKIDTNGIINCGERMKRFTKAFNSMFDTLKYKEIKNVNNTKQIFFEKNGVEVPISSLSSGEKQIVYRGSFLLKDINATRGAIVFVDEPEISMHPDWQKKIMDYYKEIFTDENGQQTSQIFAVTHSPFIIHNENRKNDKVIVLKRDENGNIVVLDKPEYEKCSSSEAVEDAFNINDFDVQNSYVYLEGKTDEKYFKKAVEVYGYTDLPFVFKCIGNEELEDKNANPTGKSALAQACKKFMDINKVPNNIIKKPQIFLGDCDTNWDKKIDGKICKLKLRQYSNLWDIKVGIENALVLDDFINDKDKFYRENKSTGNDGGSISIGELQKMDCCNYICSLDNQTLAKVFANLKDEIERLKKIYIELGKNG